MDNSFFVFPPNVQPFIISHTLADCDAPGSLASGLLPSYQKLPCTEPVLGGGQLPLTQERHTELHQQLLFKSTAKQTETQLLFLDERFLRNVQGSVMSMGTLGEEISPINEVSRESMCVCVCAKSFHLGPALHDQHGL